MNATRIVKNPMLWVLLVFVVGLVVLQLGTSGGPQRVDTSRAVQLIADGHVKKATFRDGDRLDLELAAPTDVGTGRATREVYTMYVEGRGPSLMDQVRESDAIGVYDDEPPSDGWGALLLVNVLPLLLFVLLFWFLMARMQGGGRLMQFGRSKAKLADGEGSTVTFADVAGADEAVEELSEIKAFLSDPARFTAVGAKIPKGVLLYGPPGTGKTLLARAVAGEAGVPFYSISGSDFVEMFVGVGASRVRDLFEQAKAKAPAIVFVDEIDAVGRHRGAGLGGGHDEREQTLNQLLVEMDGFDDAAGVVLIAATNRPDILDPALLRPGRFDRQIAVDAPDLRGREAILAVHGAGKPLAEGVDLRAVARRTPGFTGADLANVLNEAALLTARAGARGIDDAALDEAIDRVVGGPRRHTRVMSSTEKKMTAYHEAGHAVVAAAMNDMDPVTKVTILPRGRSLGYTMVVPVDERYSTSRNQMLDRLAYMLGGRVAEEMVFHDPTSGAADDIEKATGLARRMVTQFGMSSRIGAVRLGQDDGEVFLGRDMGHQRDYSEEVAGLVDLEVRHLIETAHDEAWQVLHENRALLDRLVLELIEHESIGGARLAELLAGVIRSPRRAVWCSGDGRAASELPPVLTPSERSALARGEDPRESEPETESPPTQIIEIPGGGHVDPPTS
ncbi:ATP-dependent zinc metalloprotease FtsH [Mobilicoccus massiliensis]|uniref:ATP-dependent zinc metalloprotease FtsH n=1 Tax=Mobilicoccus massiliensis TaxID=1522310 RepID=UPI00058DA406|nr:ATP-dependent zinc metalloprotease FtsH [Mobilicoccus massiliensis]